MNVWLRALGFVYTRYSCSGQDHDGYILRDGRFSIMWDEDRVGVVESVMVGVCTIVGDGCIV